MLYLLIVLALFVAVVMFWFVVIVGHSLLMPGNVLSATPRKFLDASDQAEELEYEKNILTADLASNNLIKSGIAENKSALDKDERKSLVGDVWLCSGRPFLFALI